MSKPLVALICDDLEDISNITKQLSNCEMKCLQILIMRCHFFRITALLRLVLISHDIKGYSSIALLKKFIQLNSFVDCILFSKSYNIDDVLVSMKLALMIILY